MGWAGALGFGGTTDDSLIIRSRSARGVRAECAQSVRSVCAVWARGARVFARGVRAECARSARGVSAQCA